MTAQGDWFVLWLLCLTSMFSMFSYQRCRKLYLPLYRDFTNPNLPSEQKARSSQVCTRLLLYFHVGW
jgi:hypothetical protein